MKHLLLRSAPRLVSLGLFALLAVPAAAQTGVTAYRDVEYARPGGISLRLDVFVPQGNGPFPVVVWIHGGGWAGGDKALAAGGPVMKQTARGYVVASVNYRLSGQAKFPAQIEDCKGAIRWLRANAATYRIDPSRLGVWGGSAGGHLVALLGTSGGVASLEGTVGGNAGVSSRVQAVVDWYGPSDLQTIDEQALPCSVIDGSSPLAPHNLLLGCRTDDCPELARQASPVTYASADDPPFTIAHGTNDCTVPPLQSQELHDTLLAAGVPSTLKWHEGAGHGGAVFSDAANLPLIEAFLDAHVKNGRSAWLVPATARSGGSGGAFWTTRLTVANPGSTGVAFTLKHLGHDADGRGGPEKTFSLGPGASVTYADVLGAVFGATQDYGALLVSSASSSLAVTAETSTPGGGGSYGQAVPAFAAADLVGAAPRSIPAVREDGAFRTNLVLANATEASLDIAVSLVAEAGTALAQKTYRLPPLGMTQVTRVVRDLGVATPVTGARLVLSTPTPSGAFAAYAALIDEATNDPRTLLPR